ncbi:aromatic-L-amino-acid decarboxylase-like [Strongylocentrotus purpuratus]|uniref:Aromatic-L-amino-acid decarboxylase n=1 Tax=Strongylocentrotus purpuratus TaxID=7668 RepID=A0A7M7NWN5_STRPU|nr:aromatic-L-amino-acid decarboxylase-like [Strongylocentrotus purpuratus]
MDGEQFKQNSEEMSSYIVKYLDNISDYRVFPDVAPGYLRKMLPEEAPVKGEEWQDIMSDVNTKIMPGVTHWQHPRFHAYFPAGNSYPSILADMLSDAIGCIGFSWAASPVCTELETIMIDWLGRMLNLPKHLLPFTDNCRGGGVIQGSASECTLVTMLAARTTALRRYKEKYPDIEDGVLLTKLVAYCSNLAHSSVEKAGIISFVKTHQLPTDDQYSLRGTTLLEAIQLDEERGLIPFYVCGTLGTTGCCASDAIDELGEICQERGLWFHVDGAYGGNALICPEFSYLLTGFEYVDSFNFNPNKWMLVNFDCSVMWIRDKTALTSTFNVNPLYLQHENDDAAIDYRHWTIPLSRRFRALKLWFVIRTYGVEGLQKYIRNHVKQAKAFEELVWNDNRFEVLGEVTMGLVCFRLKGENSLTERLLKNINDSGKLHMIPSSLNGKYVIRFAICHQYASEDDVSYAWDVVKMMADEVCRPPSRLLRQRRPSVLDNRITAFMHTTSSQYAEMLRETPESPSTSETSSTSEDDIEVKGEQEDEKSLKASIAILESRFSDAINIPNVRGTRDEINNARSPRGAGSHRGVRTVSDSTPHSRRRKQSVFQRPVAYEIDAFGKLKESFRVQRLSFDNGEQKNNSRLNNRRMTIF